MDENTIARFLASIDFDSDPPHWLWKGRTATDGTPQFRWSYETVPAHRLAYEALVGPVEHKLYRLESCPYRYCNNPACRVDMDSSEWQARKKQERQQVA